MISRVQGLPAGHVVTGSDLENVAGGFPDAKGMYSVLLWKNISGYTRNLKKPKSSYLWKLEVHDGHLRMLADCQRGSQRPH